MTKIPKLDDLLNSEDTNGSIIELDNFIGELCNYGDDYSKLTEPQKLFYFNQNLEREINNGGFNQYFCNSSGDNAHETILSLKAIGADKTADILQKAIDQFPNKVVPKDRDERTEMVEQIEEAANEVWEGLDQKFYKYEDDLNSLNIEYVKKHKDLF
ncbi:MAG: DMP19 family protein [Chitinophagaceae bacterium]|nr:DMP19 family protein [Chitinophagaceae bacterium]MCW5928727.1 DMP19 family protein [Chitinophagaceae bacterium]